MLLQYNSISDVGASRIATSLRDFNCRVTFIGLLDFFLSLHSRVNLRLILLAEDSEVTDVLLEGIDGGISPYSVESAFDQLTRDHHMVIATRLPCLFCHLLSSLFVGFLFFVIRFVG